jgi:hypothetical protein
MMDACYLDQIDSRSGDHDSFTLQQMMVRCVGIRARILFGQSAACAIAITPIYLNLYDLGRVVSKAVKRRSTPRQV